MGEREKQHLASLISVRKCLLSASPCLAVFVLAVMRFNRKLHINPARVTTVTQTSPLRSHKHRDLNFCIGENTQ